MKDEEVKNKEFFIKRGFIDIKDNASFKTVKDVSDLFNKGYKERARISTIKLDDKWEECAACISVKTNSNKYNNEILEGGNKILEASNINKKEFAKFESGEKRIRYFFIKNLDLVNRYTFYGIYELDNVATRKNIENKIYKRDRKSVV